MDEDTIRARLYDLPRLLQLRRALREAAAATDGRAEVVAGPGLAHGARVGILSGSFNPLTVAHTALAEAALASGVVDRALFTLSTSTVDKEVLVGAALEDRLLVLSLACERDPRLGVLLVNRGLYVEQAELLRSTLTPRDVVFLVGFDKIVQIFDRRYYVDRDAALERLFGLARFLVGPRGSEGPAELARLLGRPENARVARAVRPLDLPAGLRNVASSRVRAADGGAPDDHLPLEARVFAVETGAYDRPADDARPHRYRLRLTLLDQLEASGRRDDLRTAFQRALAGHLYSGRHGRRGTPCAYDAEGSPS